MYNVYSIQTGLRGHPVGILTRDGGQNRTHLSQGLEVGLRISSLQTKNNAALFGLDQRIVRDHS